MISISQPPILFVCTTTKYQLKHYIFTRYAWESPEESGKNITGSPTTHVTPKSTLLHSFLKNQ